VHPTGHKVPPVDNKLVHPHKYLAVFIITKQLGKVSAVPRRELRTGLPEERSIVH
jgi:hypothetical protein